MGDNKLLKIGVLAAATAATAAGSIFLADNNLKKLIKDMVNSEPTKLRKAEKDNVAESYKQESVIREPSTQEQDILPNIDINDVANVINNANIEQVVNQANAEPIVVESPVVEQTAENYAEPISESIPEVEQFANNYANDISNPFCQQEEPVPQVPTLEFEQPLNVEEPQIIEPQVEEPQNCVAEEDDIDFMPSLPYIAGKLETLYEEDMIDKPEQAPVQPVKASEPEIVFESMDEVDNSSSNPFFSLDTTTQGQKAPEQAPVLNENIVAEPVEEKQVQASSSNPFFDPSLINNSNIDANNYQDDIMVTRPATDEPVVAYVPQEEPLQEESSVVVSGPYIAQEEIPSQPSFVPEETSVNLPNPAEAQQEQYGQPVLFNEPVQTGRNKVIGNSFVSDEADNVMINLVVNQFPAVPKSRLVAMKAQDGSGIVFEFADESVRNENTLTNVYSITLNGDVFLPRAEERLGAINFGKSFITDMPEFRDFLQK